MKVLNYISICKNDIFVQCKQLLKSVPIHQQTLRYLLSTKREFGERSHSKMVSTDGMVVIPEKDMESLLPWNDVICAVEQAMIATSNKEDESKPMTHQPPRAIAQKAPQFGLLFAMPGFVKNMEFEGQKYNTMACKLVTSFSTNATRDPPLPNIIGNVFVFNEETGILECMMGGNLLTARRTACASTVATKNLCKKKNVEFNILAVLGPGVQGQAHAVALQKAFNFKEIRLWNRSHRAAPVCKYLAKELPDANITFFRDNEKAVRDADVIVTSTYAKTPIVELEWVKPNVHINAIGAGENAHSELSESIYKIAQVYCDSSEGAKVELAGLADIGCEVKGEIGELMLEKKPLPTEGITVYHNMGMASLDVVSAQVALHNYKKRLGLRVQSCKEEKA
ncbi:ketimine reductase mu-crystallin [Ctenocephalides felis]|uniref:ketimine reductase mu-crystallin n=1 Tax=Ctenocephalides felis TaxID=7515 RepID=UPI000E6E121C|nr:ketimine reductase mu-crystallin [Ctenocephalides felis]